MNNYLSLEEKNIKIIKNFIFSKFKKPALFKS